MEFRGTIGTSYLESTPWWPEPLRAPAGAPNVLVVLLDDIGFANVGCFGGTISTPHLDQLARRGLRYTNFTTTALCASSRAALLTGRNHHSVGFGCLPGMDTGFPGYHSELPRTAATVARHLRGAGYNTFHLGKWHLTRRAEVTIAGPYDRWPLGLGFERAYGFMDGDTSQWEPVLFEDNHYVDRPDHEGYHLTSDLASKAIDWIGGQKSIASDKPFLCYLATGAMHAPHHAPRDYIERYRGAFDAGWDHERERILKRQIEAGVIPPGTELSPRTVGVPEWLDLDAATRALFARMMEVYAGYMEHTDAQLGRLFTYLESIGILDNTVVIVTGDNGASAEGGYEGSANELRMANGMAEDLKVNVSRLEDLGGPNTYGHYPVGWAQVSNTPHKWFKQTVHYGGVKVPLILHWPGGMAAEDAGQIRSQYCHIIDIAPTLLDVARVEPEPVVDGVNQQPIEGSSMRRTIGDPGAPSPRSTQYFEMLGNRGLYRDGWKAVTFHGRAPWEQAESQVDFDSDVWELYHVDDDVAENHDLASEHPEKLEELKSLWSQEAAKYNVYPLDDRFSLRAVQVTRPDLYPDRPVWTLRKGVIQLDGSGAPRVHRLLHTVTAEIVEGGPKTSGVLIAWGGRNGGWALLVDSGHPVYAYNHLGEEVTLVRLPGRLPEGPCSIVLRSTPRPDGSADVALEVAGQAAAEGRVPRTAPALANLMEGICIGRDVGSPVCDLYEVPGEFSGVLRHVTIERSKDPAASATAAFAREATTQ